MNQKKKMAAALTAVAAYIKSGQEAQMAMAQAAQPAQPAPGTITIEKTVMVAGNAWGMSGRQAQMQMRNLLQLKSFHGAKIR